MIRGWSLWSAVWGVFLERREGLVEREFHKHLAGESVSI